MKGKKSKYSESEVLASLDRKQDVKISGRTILLLSREVWSDKLKGLIENRERKNDLGNGSYGMIDFLVNHRGYNKNRVNEFSN